MNCVRPAKAHPRALHECPRGKSEGKLNMANKIPDNKYRASITAHNTSPAVKHPIARQIPTNRQMASPQKRFEACLVQTK